MPGPRRTTVCVVFTGQATDRRGDVVYQNRAILLARLARTKIIYQEDFEDTRKVAALDAHLAERSYHQ